MFRSSQKKLSSCQVKLRNHTLFREHAISSKTRQDKIKPNYKTTSNFQEHPKLLIQAVKPNNETKQYLESMLDFSRQDQAKLQNYKHICKSIHNF